jgi:hypothetical protein
MSLARNILWLCAGVAAFPAAAQEWPKALVCKFDTQAISDYSNQWNRRVISGSNIPVTFAAIDVSKARAQFVGTGGASDVTIVPMDGGLSFVQIFESGYSLTTVFLRKGQDDRAPAVMTRHLLSSGRPFTYDLHGSCEARR